LRKQIQAGSYDRVFSFLFGVHIVSVLTGLPVYVAIRSRLGSKAWHRYLYWFYRRKNVQGVICQTEGLAQEVRAQVSCPVPVIPNPFLIPGDAGDNCADLGMYILAVGRLAAEKNFSLLIRAFVQAQLQPQVKLLIAGIGPERAKLAALISELGVEGRVKLLGLQSDDALDCLYRHAYCQVLSSNNEGFPNVVGEGLSRGVPVIATNCEHGPSEMIVDGENGLLVPVGDSEAHASALSRIFSDDVLYGQLQSKTRASMMRFSIEAIAPLWLQ
jgi:glycosyltransferase involved in cell wall biosynthesis